MLNLYTQRMRTTFLSAILVVAALLSTNYAQAQNPDHSVASQWSDVLLEAIRVDLARPTVHARNLYHTHMAIYDAWAVYDSVAQPFFLGSTQAGFEIPFTCPAAVEDPVAAQEEAISYAAYRLLTHRFQNSPGVGITMFRFNELMDDLGYDPAYLGTDYENGTPADLGNYIAEQMIAFGLQDGANENDNYANVYWESPNPNLDMSQSGNPDIIFPNQYQPLALEDCSGQTGTGCVDNFLSPEWGAVVPFALTEDDLTEYDDGEYVWKVWKDPGTPPMIDPDTPSDIEDPYKWGFSLVGRWSAHLDPADETMWDISPNSIGNIAYEDLPADETEYADFYDYENGGDASTGYEINPVTGLPYEEQWVKRADYARVLAEFWADGPDSETPPGHWFSIIEYINYHPDLEKRWMGEGPLLSDLEWDVKTHFALAGAVHDAAVSAWSIKGYYNYIRPVSAIRYMAEMGQSTDPGLPNYHPAGLPLEPGYVELIESGDPLAGDADEYVDELKIFAWRGPDYIPNPFIDVAGVGWIRVGDWWPYQRPSFVTPPFAGYISGHSTFSRAAAECLELMTGSPYFPGGMGVFDCEQNQFLVFEEGPTEFLELQWASYKDASDQCSLSRIWGGIHPPCDDIPGRKIGHDIGIQAFELANMYAGGLRPYITEKTPSAAVINDALNGGVFTYSVTFSELMDTAVEPTLTFSNEDPSGTLAQTDAGWENAYTYTWTFDVSDLDVTQMAIHAKVDGAQNMDGTPQKTGLIGNAFVIDTRNPVVSALAANGMVNDASAVTGYAVDFTYDEAMDTGVHPLITWPDEDASAALVHNTDNSMWLDDMTYQAAFDVTDIDMDMAAIDVASSMALDANGNAQVTYTELDALNIAQRNAEITSLMADVMVVNDDAAGTQVNLDVVFDEEMDQTMAPAIAFTMDDPSNSLVWNEAMSMWMDAMTYRFVFDAADVNESLSSINASVSAALDLDGNLNVATEMMDLLVVDTENPSGDAAASAAWVTDASAGTGNWSISVSFSEAMDTESTPALSFPVEDPSATIDVVGGTWTTDMQYDAEVEVTDAGVELENIDVTVSGASDANGNGMAASTMADLFSIDTRNPMVTWTSANTYVVNGYNTGAEGFTLVVVFDEAMDMGSEVTVDFPMEDPIANGLSANAGASGWINNTSYAAVYDVADVFTTMLDIDVAVSGALDARGNEMEALTETDFFDMTDPAIGVDEIEGQAFGHVYPNPAEAGKPLNVEVLQGGQVLLEVHDAAGRLVVSEQQQTNAGTTLHVPTKGWSAGTYLVRLELEGKAQHFIVEVR